MEVAPHSPSPSDPSTSEPMKTDLPKLPLHEDIPHLVDSETLFRNTNDTQEHKTPAKRFLRRARAHPANASRTWNVFVGDLRSEVTEADLLHAFSGCGPISSVHIVRDSLTGQQRGFGFIHFKTAEAQLNALKVSTINYNLYTNVRLSLYTTTTIMYDTQQCDADPYFA